MAGSIEAKIKEGGVHVWLDVDSTLADFIGGCHELFGELGYDTDIGDVDSWDFFENYEPPADRDEFEDTIDSTGEEFWRNLETTSFFRPLMHAVEQIRVAAEDAGVPFTLNVATCVKTHDAKMGRIKWLNEHLYPYGPIDKIRFPATFRDKGELVGECEGLSILVDDSVPALQAFADNGGTSIKVATTLNSGLSGEDADDSVRRETIHVLEYIRSCITTLRPS